MLIIVRFFISFKIKLAPIFTPYSLPLPVGPTLGDKKERRFVLASLIGTQISIFIRKEKKRLDLWS